MFFFHVFKLWGSWRGRELSNSHWSHDLLLEEMAAKGVDTGRMWLWGGLTLLAPWTPQELGPKPHTEPSFSDSSQNLLCSGSWRTLQAGPSQTTVHHLHFIQTWLSPKWRLPGIPRILPASSAVSSLCSEGSFIKKAWRPKSLFCSFVTK